MNKRSIFSRTKPFEKVLRMFIEQYPDPLYGAEICKRTHLGPGTVYPILARMTCEADWATVKEEDIDPKVAGRPKRRLYQLTPKGYRAGKDFLPDASISTPVNHEEPIGVT